MRIALPLALTAVAALTPLLVGCPSPSLYTTPRTLDPGALQLQLSIEGFGAVFQQTTQTANANGTTTSQRATVSMLTPTPPTVGIRYGVADGFEVGARVADFSTLAGDAKFRLLKGTIDLAVDPGMQVIDLAGGITTATGGVFYFNLPVLLGINLSEALSLVWSPGVVYCAATQNLDDSTYHTQAAFVSSGLLARLGLGLNIRTSPTQSMQPEITVMKSFQGDESLMYFFGFGYIYGSQPDYSDLAARPPAAVPVQDVKQGP
jgi:hypothetical protein